MDTTQIVVVALTGILAGAVNTVAGAGSLLTYPVLVALGLAPLAANVTNDLGVVPGNISGAIALRESLRDQRGLMRQLVPRVVLGSLLGAGLLLLAPATAFAWAAPPMLLIASGLTLAQPALARRTRPERRNRRAFYASIDAISVYGGYFGTGIGLLFMAALGLFVDDSVPRLNAAKTVLQMLANGLAGILFAFVAPVNWPFVAVMSAGTLAGGRLGAMLATRISPDALRVTVAVIGIGAGLWLLARQL